MSDNYQFHAIFPYELQAKSLFTNSNFLLFQVLVFQNEIRDMKVGEKNISLTDICFKPLYPDYNYCTIESPLNYFQNNWTRLNETDGDICPFANYLDHMDFCAKAPLSVSGSPISDLSCLGRYGGPNFPNVVFGGFDNKEFLNGSAIVITFVVNNSVSLDSDQIKYATTWESAYLKKVQQFAKDNPDLVIAYQAEVRALFDKVELEWYVILHKLCYYWTHGRT